MITLLCCRLLSEWFSDRSRSPSLKLPSYSNGWVSTPRYPFACPLGYFLALPCWVFLRLAAFLGISYSYAYLAGSSRADLDASRSIAYGSLLRSCSCSAADMDELVFELSPYCVGLGRLPWAFASSMLQLSSRAYRLVPSLKGCLCFGLCVATFFEATRTPYVDECSDMLERSDLGALRRRLVDEFRERFAALLRWLFGLSCACDAPCVWLLAGSLRISPYWPVDSPAGSGWLF